ncbi:MAG: hypothetical protein ACE5IM_12455, partial [Nitrospinota bacterium]
MAVIKAQRAFLAVPAGDVPALLAALQAGGLLEPIAPEAWPVEEGELGPARPFGGRGFDLEETAGRLRRCLSFLETHAPERGGLKRLFSPTPTLDLQRLADAFRDFPLDGAALRASMMAR